MDKRDRLAIFDHYEKYFGEMKASSRIRDFDIPDFAVFEYAAQPFDDCSSFLTFGLSDRLMETACDCSGRFELLISVPSEFDERAMAAVLCSVAELACRLRRFPGLHGTIAGMGPVRIGGSESFAHFYLTHPGYFPSGVDVCQTVDPHADVLQLIPITSAERDFIRSSGWEKFEELLCAQDVDLTQFDLRAELNFAAAESGC